MKDSSIPYREPNDQEKVLYCRPNSRKIFNNTNVAAYNPTYGVNSKISDMVKKLENKDYSKNNYKEKGIVINVKKNEKKDEDKTKVIEETKERKLFQKNEKEVDNNIKCIIQKNEKIHERNEKKVETNINDFIANDINNYEVIEFDEEDFGPLI